MAMGTLEESLPDLFSETQVSTQYGVRLDFADGSWVLVRPSGTEPYIRIYVESEDVETLVDAVEVEVEPAMESAGNS